MSVRPFCETSPCNCRTCERLLCQHRVCVCVPLPRRALSEIREVILRRSAVFQAAIIIQKIFRGYLGRITYLRLKARQVQEIRSRYRLVRIVQRLWRGFM